MSLRHALGGLAGRYSLDALLGTVRFHVISPAPQPPVIYTLWHGRLLPLTYLRRGQGIATLISRSGDGEYIARVVEGWGYTSARGSSSRGGSEALRGLVRAAQHGASLAFTPDGPRGPRQKMKRGVLTAAQLSGLPIVAMSGAATSAWWLEGWDRFLMPKPFATMFVRYADPIMVPRVADEVEISRIEQTLEQTLNELTERCDADALRG